MKKNVYIVLALVSLFFSFLFFAIYNNWIIFRSSSYKSEVNQQITNVKAKKSDVYLYYWQNNKWQHEKVSILFTGDKAKNIKYLINNWLTLLDEEEVMDKKVTLQDVLLDINGQLAYLSFDRTLFAENSATFAKWMLLEGLLKTLRESGIGVQNVFFLVHHQIMEDYHLDFSKPWPMYGFLQ